MTSTTTEGEHSWLTGETTQSESELRKLKRTSERIMRAVRHKRKRAEARYDHRKILLEVTKLLNEMCESISAG